MTMTGTMMTGMTTIGTMTGTTIKERLTSSLRARVVAWTTIVVLISLVAVMILMRSFYLGQVTDTANNAVEQEADEFSQFANEALNPETGERFRSPQRLIETYMSRQIPDSDENMFGFVDGRIIQMDFSNIEGDHPAPVAHDGLLVHEILNSPNNSGVFEGTHWARVQVGEDDYFAILYHTEEARARVANNMAWITVISLVGLIAAMIMAWIVSGQIVAPIRRLQRVASSISNSDLTQRVPVKSSDELGQLACTFNDMLDRIEVAYRDQRQFVDDAGHELRTPITVVRGQLELLPFSSEEDKAKSIHLCLAELDRMARMVNDLLTLAVADSGDFVQLEKTDLSELMIAIDDKASIINDRARLVEVAEGEVMADPERITEAILELYGNALKYSDTEVELGSSLHGSGKSQVVRFWVRDRGEGISKKKQDKLFERFTRGDDRGTRPDGAGLGLSIVRAIGEAHGGRAYVESTEGLGSIFGIEIPAPDTTQPKE